MSEEYKQKAKAFLERHLNEYEIRIKKLKKKRKVVKFNLEGEKTKLNKTIDEFDKIKHKIDYVVSCNGNFTEVEYKRVIEELCK